MNRVLLTSLVLIVVWSYAVVRANGGDAAAGEPSARPQSLTAELAYLDVNGDGAIDARELADGQQMASMLLMLSWDECDQDLDGKLTAAEFQSAASKAMQALLSYDTDADQQAEEALANAVPMSILLQQLGRDEAYAEELAALREALDDLDDDEAVVTHVVTNPVRYPRLGPVVRTWVRHYPVKPRLRSLVRPHLKHHRKSVEHPRATVGPKPVRKTGRPATAKPRKPAPKRGPRPRPGGPRP